MPSDDGRRCTSAWTDETLRLHEYSPGLRRAAVRGTMRSFFVVGRAPMGASHDSQSRCRPIAPRCSVSRRGGELALAHGRSSSRGLRCGLLRFAGRWLPAARRQAESDLRVPISSPARSSRSSSRMRSRSGSRLPRLTRRDAGRDRSSRSPRPEAASESAVTAVAQLPGGTRACPPEVAWRRGDRPRRRRSASRPGRGRVGSGVDPGPRPSAVNGPARRGTRRRRRRRRRASPSSATSAESVTRASVFA